jgi:NDP-sugar pyrophosphorylase family protein
MPDTYFHGELPYEKLCASTSPLELSLFKIREDQKGKLGQVLVNDQGQVQDVVDKDPSCSYEYSWGALSFSEEFIPFIDPAEPHVGYAFPRALKDLSIIGSVVDAEYFDCGTPSEYLRLLRALWT